MTQASRIPASTRGYSSDTWAELSERVYSVLEAPEATKSRLSRTVVLVMIADLLAAVLVSARISQSPRAGTITALWATFVVVYVVGRVLCERSTRA